MSIIKELNIKGAKVYIDNTYIVKETEVPEILKRVSDIAVKAYKNRTVESKKE